MQRVALILPWVGELPWYYGLFEASLRHAGVELVLLHKDLGWFERRIGDALGVPVSLSNGYKLCDFKPMYGEIFAAELAGFDWWAFGDCDFIYGRRFGAWVKEVTEGPWDVACVRRDWVSGGFTLMRNCEKVNSLFRRSPCWKEAALAPRCVAFDELGPNWLIEVKYNGKSFADLRRERPYFASVLWAADDVRFRHEEVVSEDGLGLKTLRMRSATGELTLDGEEIACFHMVCAKAYHTFRGRPIASSEVGDYTLTRYGYSAGLADLSPFAVFGREVSSFAVFTWRFICGHASERQRVRRVLRRVILRRERWWE